MCRSASSLLVAWLCAALIALPLHAHADAPALPDAAPVEPPANAPSGTTPPPPPASPATLAPPPSPSPTPVTGATLSPAPTPRATPKIEVVRKRPHIGLLVGGLSLFAAAWVADIGFTYGYEHEPKTTSLIPIAGPFIQLTEKYGIDGPPVDTGSAEADDRINKNIDKNNSTIHGLALAGAAISGVAQIAGVVLAIAGIAAKRKVTRYAQGGTSLSYAPYGLQNGLRLDF